MAGLAVNVDHVATLREARKTTEPDPVTAAMLAEMGGADQITFHLREVRRHFQNRDARLISEMAQTLVNLEMAATPGIIGIAREVGPDVVTLVPEKRQELTTEGGLDVKGNLSAMERAINELRDAGIRVSCFVDPDISQIKAAIEAGADIVEIHTGAYAEADSEEVEGIELEKVAKVAGFAAKGGLRVSAGHGLNYRNAEAIAAIPEIEELSIGHAVIARAVMVGLTQAVQEMMMIVE